MPDPLEPALPRTIIRNAAWYAAAKAHVYHRDVDLATEGDTITAIGPALSADYSDAVEIDGRGFAILPGFVDMHAHPSSEPMLKRLTNELGSRQLYELAVRIPAVVRRRGRGRDRGGTVRTDPHKCERDTDRWNEVNRCAQAH